MTTSTQNWKKLKLGDACSIAKGVTYKTEDYSSESDGQVFLTLKCIAKGGGFNFEGIKYFRGDVQDEQLVQPGDLIIANTDLTRAGDVIGAPLVVPKIRNGEKYVISMDISKLTTDDSALDKNYLYHYLTSSIVRNYMRSISNGSTVLHLNVRLVSELDVPTPTIPVQKKIAEMLDSIENQIHEIDQIIQKSEILKQGLMRDLLTKGIGHKKFKNTKIGEFPIEWSVEKLSDFALVERGKFSHRPRNDPQFYGGSIPFIQTGDVVNSNGRIRSYSQTLNDRGLKISKLFSKGTIVLTIAANIGDTGILEFDACFPDSLVGITPSNKLNSLYLEYYLRSRKSFLNSIATQSAQKNINLAKLNPMLIAVPPIGEQQEIGKILSTIDDKISSEFITKKKLQSLKNGLMQDIFSQKVNIN